MDDMNNPDTLEDVARETPNVRVRAFDDYSDGIDWDEITATTQPDWEAGRYAFRSADYPTQEAAEAALWELIQSIGRKARERQAAGTGIDAPRT